jgi:hypothetical protein
VPAVYRSTARIDVTTLRILFRRSRARALSYPSPARIAGNVWECNFYFSGTRYYARAFLLGALRAAAKMRKYVFATRRALIPKRTKETQVFTQPARGSNAPVYERLRTPREWPRFHDSRRRERRSEEDPRHWDTVGGN